ASQPLALHASSEFVRQRKFELHLARQRLLLLFDFVRRLNADVFDEAVVFARRRESLYPAQSLFAADGRAGQFDQFLCPGRIIPGRRILGMRLWFGAFGTCQQEGELNNNFGTDHSSHDTSLRAASYNLVDDSLLSDVEKKLFKRRRRNPDPITHPQRVHQQDRAPDAVSQPSAGRDFNALAQDHHIAAPFYLVEESDVFHQRDELVTAYLFEHAVAHENRLSAGGRAKQTGAQVDSPGHGAERKGRAFREANPEAPAEQPLV